MVLLGDEAHVEYVISVNLEIVLILTQHRCPVCAERTISQKSFWMHPMELLGNVGHVEPHFDPFGDSFSVGARQVHGLHRTYHRLGNHFGRT